MATSGLDDELERWVAELGYELVELEHAGSSIRPILRLRVDRPDDEGDPAVSRVTVDDCSRVSRALEARLDGRPGLAERYVLEVSSPGVERPLSRRRDWERFAGKEVALHGKRALAGRAKRLEGVLLGVDGEEGSAEERVRLRLAGGEEVGVPRVEIHRAHLVYRWSGAGRPRGSGGAPDS